MAILSKDEFKEAIKARIGESTEDADIKFMEDMIDTYDNMETLSADNAEWKRKYEENDAEWKRKYRERFFTTGAEIKEEQKEHIIEEDGRPRTFSELFKEREG